MRRMRGFKELVGVEDAVRIVLGRLAHRVREAEEVGLEEALGRVCGEDVEAPMDSPPFDRSSVDGYAVRAEDTFGASPNNPIELRIVGEIAPGDSPSTTPRIGRGEAAVILTGAPLPWGANAVVMAEDSERRGDIVEVHRQVRPLQNVSRRGEDYRRGEVVVRRGTRIRPWHIAALASLNIPRVKVVRKPLVGVLSTGGELIEVGGRLEPGKVVNSSKPMLKSLLREEGAEPIDLGTVPDDLEEIRGRVREAIGGVDALIITGGTSVGERDLVPEAVESLGEILVHGLMIRPGRPTGVGIVDGKPVFMLSGFPVAALVGFDALVRPTLKAMMDAGEEPRPRVRGRLTRRVTTPPGTRSYMRVRVVRRGGETLVEPLMLTGSGLLSTLTKANGILIIPEDMEGFDEGERVEVELLREIEEG